MPRLTIQYTIELEEIERETKRLIDKAMDALIDVTEVDTADADLLSYRYLEVIDSLRKRLNRADHNLNDASQIINGYLRYKAAKSANEQIEKYQEEQNEIPATD